MMNIIVVIIRVIATIFIIYKISIETGYWTAFAFSLVFIFNELVGMFIKKTAECMKILSELVAGK